MLCGKVKVKENGEGWNLWGDKSKGMWGNKDDGEGGKGWVKRRLSQMGKSITGRRREVGVRWGGKCENKEKC